MSSSSLLKASAWTLALTWGSRALSVVSVFVLARLLSPEDFGVVAIAFIFYHFLHSVSTSGAVAYIIKADNLTEHELNQIWTSNLLLKLCIASLLALLSTPIAGFFNTTSASLVIKCYAGFLLLNSLSNFWQPIKHREHDVKLITVVGFIAKISSFVVTISIATRYESYWALVCGELISIIINLVAGYLIVDHRPKLTRPNNKAMWVFFVWMIGEKLLGFTRGKVDSIIIGRFYGTQTLGEYTLASRILDIPSNDIMNPLISPLLSSLTKLKNHLEHLYSRFLSSLLAANLVFSFICFSIVITGDFVVDLLLGSDWANVKPILKVLPLGIYCFATITFINQLLILLDKNKARFWLDVIYTSGIVWLLLWVAVEQDINVLYQSRAVLYWFGMLLFCAAVLCFSSINFLTLLICTVVPFVLGWFTYLASSLVVDHIPLASYHLIEILKYIAFVVFYLLVTLCFLMLGKDNREIDYVRNVLEQSSRKVFRRADGL